MTTETHDQNATSEVPKTVFGIDNHYRRDGVERRRRANVLFETRAQADAECQRLRDEGCEGELIVWKCTSFLPDHERGYDVPVVRADGSILEPQHPRRPLRAIPIIGDVDSETGNVTLRPGCQFP